MNPNVLRHPAPGPPDSDINARAAAFDELMSRREAISDKLCELRATLRDVRMPIVVLAERARRRSRAA